MSIPTTTVTTTPAAEPEAEPSSEFGATVQDAQRLLRRAKYVYVFFRVGSDIWDTEIVEVSKAAMARKLKRLEALKALPCELNLSGRGGYNTLTFGNSAPIEKAAEARR